MVAAERIFRRCGAPQFSTSNFMVFRGGPNGEEVCPLNQKSRTVKYLSHTFTYVQLSCRLRRYTPIIFLARRVTKHRPFFLPFQPFDDGRESSRWSYRAKVLCFNVYFFLFFLFSLVGCFSDKLTLARVQLRRRCEIEHTQAPICRKDRRYSLDRDFSGFV